MSISAIAPTVKANPIVAENPAKYSMRQSSFMKKVSILAIGIFAIHAATNVPQAEAGFGFFTVCMGICSSVTGGAFIPACVAACVASLATPTP